MDKAAELKKIEAELVANASLPLREANLVFGEGNIDCEVMFIGEAPGVNEDRLRRPFVGRGGQLLDDMIRGLGWKREDVYITNIVKRRPPENRDPLARGDRGVQAVPHAPDRDDRSEADRHPRPFFHELFFAGGEDHARPRPAVHGRWPDDISRSTIPRRRSAQRR